MRLPGGGFSFRVERNAGWLLFLLQVGWFFWRLPYCVNPLTCMREEIGLMWCWPFPAFMEENFEPKLSYKRFRRFSPIFFWNTKTLEEGFVFEHLLNQLYIYTVYTAFLSEDFQNMFDFERKITTKVFYFEASQIYRWLTVEDFFGAEFFSSKNLLIWGPGGGFCRFQLPKKLGPSRHPGAWMPSQWGFMQAKQETRTIGFFHMLCICIYSL